MADLPVRSLEQGRYYRAQGFIYGIRGNDAQSARGAVDGGLHGMGWTDYEFVVTRPEGAATIPFQGGVLMIQNKDLRPDDYPYPVEITRGKWDKGTTALPLAQGIAFGGPRVAMLTAQEIGAAPEPIPEPPSPPNPSRPPEPPSSDDDRKITKSEQSASFLPVILVAGLVGAAVWAWKSSQKRRNL